MKPHNHLLTIILLIIVFGLVACGRRDNAEVESAANSSAATAPTDMPLPVGDLVKGKELFSQTCVACHGPVGEGVPNLGKDMTTSEFIASKTDAELVEFIKVGRDTSDPLNTTNVAMPAKGGNPALSDQDLVDIVTFVRSLQK